MENKIKHLEMIQNTIQNMSKNSFMLKGWAVTIVAGVFALSSQNKNYVCLIISYIPIIIFWGLDSYYLQQERKHRLLYDEVRKLSDEEIDFSMKIVIKGKKMKYSWISTFMSITEIGFYLPLAISVLLITIIIS